MNQEIKRKADLLKGFVDNINDIMSDLHTENVEVRIIYHEVKSGSPPKLEIHRLVEHVDYL